MAHWLFKSLSKLYLFDCFCLFVSVVFGANYDNCELKLTESRLQLTLMIFSEASCLDFMYLLLIINSQTHEPFKLRYCKLDPLFAMLYFIINLIWFIEQRNNQTINDYYITYHKRHLVSKNKLIAKARVGDGWQFKVPEFDVNLRSSAIIKFYLHVG